jgi:hypothetical protein
VRYATGAHLPVDPISRHPDIAGDIVGFEQPARPDPVISATAVRLLRDRDDAVRWHGFGDLSYDSAILLIAIAESSEAVLCPT